MKILGYICLALTVTPLWVNILLSKSKTEYKNKKLISLGSFLVCAAGCVGAYFLLN